MGIRDLVFVGAVVAGAVALGSGLLRPAVEKAKPAEIQPADDLDAVVSRVDAEIRRGWAAKGLAPARRADELAVMRRLSLGLAGTIPSLEEVRGFERRPEGTRVEAWINELLRDRRTADALAERLARAFVGTEDGPFIVFRRRRFAAWLSDAILEDRPYDQIVREMIAGTGLWTDRPATNFLTVTRAEDTEMPDPERLGARVARAFLGVRLDCAQCHDHPFQPWKQEDFRGLAAFFGEARSNLKGVNDAEMVYRPLDRKTHQPVAVAPRVPFLASACPEGGTSRQKLAGWIVDPRNEAFARATTNRFWAVLFGRPLVEPIDDLPVDGPLPPALEALAEDFASHGYRLHRLIRAIASTEAYRLDSASSSSPLTDDHEAAWAMFPMTRLRPDQVAGAITQSAKLSTLGPESAWVVRLFAYTARNDFVRRYGDSGEDEFDARPGTIPQRLLLMNGDLVRDRIRDDLFNASNRIATLSPDDARAVEAAYLSVLTRRPSPEESDYFVDRLKGTSGQERKDRMTDLIWTLMNATEFSWNH